MGLFRNERKAWVNLGLILFNVVYFLIVDFTGGSTDIYHTIDMGGLTVQGILVEQRYYLLFTSMFMHWGISHLINNLLVLFVLGDNLERAMGRFRYLLFYLVCGAASGMASVYYYAATNQNVVSVGASGAIFGVIGGLLCIVIRNKGRLEDLSSRQLLVMVAFSLYHGFTSAGVNNMAHISGLAVGALLALVLYRKPRQQSGGYYA